MSPPFRVTLVAMALVAALGSVPASAQRGGGGGGGFHGRGFQGGFNRGFAGPGFNRGFRPGSHRVQPWLLRAALRLQSWLRRAPLRLFWTSRLCRAGLYRAAALVVVGTTTTTAMVGTAPLVKGITRQGHQP